MVGIADPDKNAVGVHFYWMISPAYVKLKLYGFQSQEFYRQVDIYT